MAERSKALRQGRNLFGGVGSNPTLVTLFCGSLPRARTKQQATGRIELPTLGLQDQCSATELSRRRGKDKATERIELSTPGLRDLCSATELSGLCDRMAEWSKALRSGRSLFGGVGSNPTLTTFARAAPNPPVSAVVQWLGYLAFTQETRVQTPAAESAFWPTATKV